MFSSNNVFVLSDPADSLVGLWADDVHEWKGKKLSKNELLFTEHPFASRQHKVRIESNKLIDLDDFKGVGTFNGNDEVDFDVTG